MIVFQWRPPWTRLAQTARSSNKTLVKGKGREVAACSPETLGRRFASLWNLATTEAQHPPSDSFAAASSSLPVGFYFYPSFYYDTSTGQSTRVPRKQARYLRRLMQRRLGPAHTFFPATAAPSHRPLVEGHLNRTQVRPASHSSYASTSAHTYEDTQPPPTVPLKTRLPHARRNGFDDRAHTQGAASRIDQSSAARLNEPDASLNDWSHSSHVIEVNISTQLERIHASLRDGAVERARWRLYLIFRLMKRRALPLEWYRSRTGLAVKSIISDVCKAHLPYYDIENIEEILRRCSEIETQNGRYRPRRAAYNALVKAYAQAHRAEEALSVMDEMRALGLPPNAYTYTDMITMYAQLSDPEKAQRLFDDMKGEGVQAAQATYTSLMNAYVEAGFWDQAIEIVEYLETQSENLELKPDIHTCTTLMKCYILMGAPLDEVMMILESILSRGLKPTSRTFVLILHAACDAGALDFAEEVFAKLDAENEAGLVNAHTFTVMIRGMLRAGKQDAANDYFQEMLKRKIKPHSATWSVLLKAYASGGHPQTKTILAHLVDDYMLAQSRSMTARQRARIKETDVAIGRGEALENLFGPVIATYAKIASDSNGSRALDAPEQDAMTGESASEQPTGVASNRAPHHEALAVFERLFSQPDARPSVHIYTAMLDSYRVLGDIESMRKLWPHIVEHAGTRIKHQAFSEHISQAPASQRNLLCLPLSIYMDAMSTHHLHQEVASAWLEVQRLGCGFDAGNWNHLIVAFIRAGEVERAFWTAEELLKDVDKAEDKPEPAKVLQQHGTLSPVAQTTSADDNHDLSDEHDDAFSRDKAETPMRPPNRSYQYHAARRDKSYEQNRLDTSLASEGRPTEVTLPSEGVHTAHADQESAESEAELHTGPSKFVGDFARRYVPFGRPRASPLTARYRTLRHRQQVENWHLFDGTLRTLLSAQRQSTGSYIEGTSSPDNSDSDSSRWEWIAQKYPRTSAAISAYQTKLQGIDTRARSRRRVR